jgi:uncharacterized membrane protein
MATYDAQNEHGTTQVVTINPNLITYTHVMYALHAIAVIAGILTSASIVGQFIFGLPSIIAVVMNYVRRNEARGTWLESHFRWQLRTFWFTVLWSVLALLAFGWLIVILIGLPLLIGSFVIVGLWAAYRIVRGWLALRDARPMPR